MVTGANGFIGTPVCEHLLSIGRKVQGAIRSPDRSVTMAAGCKSISVGDIGPQTFWGDALAGVEAVVHLAARVHIRHDARAAKLSTYRHINTEGTLNLARQCAAAGVRRFIFLSSIKVNGERTDSGRPFRPEDKPDPADSYGISKMEAEKSLLNLADETGMEVVIIRPPLVYGPGVKANFLRLMKLVDTGIPLPLASINNRRSLIYLENLVDAVCTCIDHPNSAGKIFLVSDGEDLSTPDLLRLLAKAMGKPARLIPVSNFFLSWIAKLSGRFNPFRKIAGSLTVDISKTRKDIGWLPPYSVENGIQETVNWYMNQ